MPLVSTGDIVAEAGRRRVGAAAFNVVTLEHAEAVIAGAEQADRPVILQVSENAVRFHGDQLAPVAAAVRAAAEAARVPVALHLDHVESAPLLRQAPGHGFGSVMVDASRLPYADNVTTTAAAVAFGHRHGLWVEAELGTVGGKDGAPPLSPHAPGARTDPDQAAEFVAATGVDALAVAVGSAHAMTSRDAVLDQDLIHALAAAVPVPLVLHGSSGVPDARLRAAVRTGITKVNIGTALGVSFTAAVRAALAHDPDLVDPRRFLSPARRAMTDTVVHFLRVLT